MEVANPINNQLNNQIYITQQSEESFDYQGEINKIRERIQKSEEQRKKTVSRIKNLKNEIQQKRQEIGNYRKDTIETANQEELKIEAERKIFKDEQKRLLDYYHSSVREFQKVSDYHLNLKNQHQDIINQANRDVFLKSLELKKIKSEKQINRRRQIKYNQNEIKYNRQSQKQIKIFQSEIEEIKLAISEKEKHLENLENHLARRRHLEEVEIREKMITTQTRLDQVTSMIDEKETIIKRLKFKFLETKAQHLTSLINNHNKDLTEILENKKTFENEIETIYLEYQTWKNQTQQDIFSDLRQEISKKKNRLEYCQAQIQGLKRKNEKKNQKYVMLLEEETKDLKPIHEEVKEKYLMIDLHKKHIENIVMRLEDERSKHLDHLSIIDKDIDRAQERFQIAQKRIKKSIGKIEETGVKREKGIELQIEDIEADIKEQRELESVLDEKILELSERIEELIILENNQKKNNS